MASAMLHTSMLPCIKCSGCGAEVQLSMMGDHNCNLQADDSSWPMGEDEYDHQAQQSETLATLEELKEPDESEEYQQPLEPQKVEEVENTRSATESLSSISARHLKSRSVSFSHSRSGSLSDHSRKSSKESSRSSKDKPPPIDMAAALGISRPVAPPVDSPMLTRSKSPLPTQSLDHTSEDVPIETIPERPLRPPSPSSEQSPPLKQRDFPISTSNEPQAPNDVHLEQIAKPPIATKQGPIIPHSIIQPPKPKGGLNFLKRMNSLSPKDSQDREKSSNLFRRKSSKQLSRKEITLVQGSFRRGEDSITPNFPITHAALVQTSELSTLAKRDGNGKFLPSGPAPPRPPPPQRVDGLMEHLHTNVATVMVHPTSPEGQASSPLATSNGSDFDFQSNQLTKPRDSVSSIYSVQRLPSTERMTTGGSALRRISEVEDGPGMETDSTPSTWPPTPDPAFDSSSGAGADQVPPLPGFVENVNRSWHHTPSESISSNGSRSAFGDHASSFRSSPPTSNGSSFSLRKPGMDDSIQDGMDARSRAANFSRPRLGETSTASPLATSPSITANSPQSPTLPESPMDPAMHDGTLKALEKGTRRPTLPIVSYHGEPPRYPLQKAHTSPLPEPTRPPAGKRAFTGSKGDCRGCEKPIVGKSMKAADGRLTGRYHRECFVCKTCSLPFQTADFYVFENFPYCAYHYHHLNESLCHSCNQGIEGQYLESQPKRKYHLHCFTCHDCRKPLTQDYFEINHFFYCEFDARRAYQRTNIHGGGRRFPERRTTKLMMM